MHFLKIIIPILNKKQAFVPEKLTMAGLRYLYNAIKVKPTFTYIQSDLFRILTDICLPYLTLSA